MTHSACGDAHSWWWIAELCPVCWPGEGTSKQATPDPTSAEIKLGKDYLAGRIVSVPSSGKIRNEAGQVLYSGSPGTTIYLNKYDVIRSGKKGWEVDRPGSEAELQRQLSLKQWHAQQGMRQQLDMMQAQAGLYDQFYGKKP